MLHRLLLLPLAPALIVEGRWVRARTPRLPEPDGAREGICGDGPDLRLLIIGDSAAAGVGAPTQDEALAGQVSRKLGDHYRVHWHLEALTGRRIDDYLPPNDPLPAFEPDAILISIGVNDVTSSVSAASWLGKVGQLLERLRDRYRPALILFTDVPPMDHFPALPQPLRWYLGRRAREFNNGLGPLLRGRRDVTRVSVLFENDPAVMARDGFHPGPEGYRVWANEVRSLVRSRLRDRQTTPPSITL
ncbi:SGNH/GDSL hydrolase family protein [Marinobacter halodurans]|uniref:SGNH/GDSL hydrolase family protein n=1 Tax=Marinobacter halodurans TaxID=2528979 RepID=A0ABY1ZUN0_9GAMM|nr:SGNH/GDSL hydrolase family protein [Marinobacter halodurans]TBW59593.1 SGNH/GDSL hydrolase family protein [Marinobacter halodurans]